MTEDTHTIGEIVRTLNRLETGMTEGFKGVHQRQDKTNGRVSALEKWKYGLGIGIAVLAATSWPNISALAKALTGI